MIGNVPKRESPDDQSHRGVSDRADTGLYSGFEAYQTATDADYRTLLTSGIVVPDTNVFLNLYRYNEQTRRDLFSVMNALGDRLWVPHWVMVEFWRIRESVLQDPRDTVLTIKELSGNRDKALSTLRGWTNRVGLASERVEALAKILSDAFSTVVDDVTELAELEASADFARDTNTDPVLADLEPLLRGRVGPPLDPEAFKEALSEARRRTEEQRPPGYKDAAKGGDRAAGDYLVWRQVLLHAQAKKRDVLLVTGDVKDDWWRRERGEARGPRPELVEEMKSFAHSRLFMLRPESLLIKARQLLRIDVHDQSLQDVERVDRIPQHWDDPLPGEEAESPWFPYLEDITSNWAKILELVRQERKVAWILLANATATALTGNTLTIEFRRQGDAQGFAMSGHDNLLQSVLRALYGHEFVVNCTWL
jgi:predicted nucleic acid-binding protein